MLSNVLHQHPELAIFVSLVVGHVIGGLHWKGIGLGNTVGTLIAGIIVGIFAEPQLPDLLRWVFFYLFLFAIGYSVGPQFFGSLKKDALPQIAMALVVAVSGLGTAIAVAVILDLDAGSALGVLSGGLTTSAALGTGLNAIEGLAVPSEMKKTLIANAPLADAITYGFGDIGLILFLTVVGPRLMRADLRREARAMEDALTAGNRGAPALSSALFALRAYRIENAAAEGVTVQALEQRFSAARLSVQRVRRGTEFPRVEPGLALRAGDAVVVAARLCAFADMATGVGAEIHDDPELLSVPQVTASIVVTRRATRGTTLGELATAGFTRGVYLQSVHRGQEMMPREAWTVLERGDVLRAVGAPADIERVTAHLGFVERDVGKTDLGFLAGGLSVGILLGALRLDVYGVPLGVGTAGAILLVGLAAGWARGRYPVFGAIPEPAQRVLADLGLMVFVAIIGLTAGPHAVEALDQNGMRYFASIFFAGMIVTIVPVACGTMFARSVLKMSPLMVLGGIAGAQTCPPGLTALREASGSNVAALAYTVPYAIGYIVITMWGPVVVAVIHAVHG